ncbi:MAG: gamma-glutamylcyclotransferase [Desulfobacterales bacterium]|uniref:Putative gamma-glutamylcyclotransferase n=1 Tax=Candidatus Desulfatibia vada TaxID=2841696 RepID=A0A8J6NVQ9_9BACT|nr:gamma-glutamylcyclotransferase [Candidatus Desulfatibia vada]
MFNFFAYGTLMIPDVMYAVTTREFRFIDAILRSYSRFTVKGESYPGIIPVTDAVTEGVIYFNVDELSLERLDEFEGDLYQRTPILVETVGEEILNAETYVVKPECRDYLSSKGWDVNKFTKTYLETFLESYQDFQKNS